MAKRYFLKNGLLLNETKTQSILIGSRQLLSEVDDNLHINFNVFLLNASAQHRKRKVSSQIPTRKHILCGKPFLPTEIPGLRNAQKYVIHSFGA
ncbi:hypothetical protein SK128_009557 [Halocaridina rubra]|uniref:Uncharacterized protein n=1 Tax=Halocaridina rubra TaxID=373956 RepID=A0AAN8X361_HALRR